MKRKPIIRLFFACLHIQHVKWSLLIIGVFSLMSFSAIAQDMSATWKFESQRKEIAPVYAVDKKNTFRGEPTLTLSGGGKEYADGHWYKIVEVEAEKYFLFRSYFNASNLEEPNRCVLARIIWLNETNKQVGFTEYPVTLAEKTKEGWNIFEQLYKVPAETKRAKLELHYRWDADGIVRFSEVSFEKTTPPEPRMVRVATVHLKPHNSKSPQDNLNQFAKLVAEAGVQKPDIICLPEAITLAGTR